MQVRAGEHLRQNITAINAHAYPDAQKTQCSLACQASTRWHVRCFLCVITSVDCEVWLQLRLRVDCRSL